MMVLENVSQDLVFVLLSAKSMRKSPDNLIIICLITPVGISTNELFSPIEVGYVEVFSVKTTQVSLTSKNVAELRNLIPPFTQGKFH